MASIKKGETIMNDDGTLYCTFMNDFGNGFPMNELKIKYSDGSRPITGSVIEKKVTDYLCERLLK